MPRYKLTVEYDGGPFFGFQRQADLPTVQAALERAVAGLTQEEAVIYCAGRTDTGVHARGQVVHFDTAKDLPPDTVCDALNAHLRPDPVAVLAADRVDDGFHARFSAVRRHYLYRIICRRAPLAVERGQAWRVARPLDAGAMASAVGAFVGHHDFTTFRAAGCQAKSPVKTMERAELSCSGEEIQVRFSAPSFLHSQVRSMVGSLVEVGLGKQPPGWIAQLLDRPDRHACGPLAPPDGLYLMAVDY